MSSYYDFDAASPDLAAFDPARHCAAAANGEGTVFVSGALAGPPLARGGAALVGAAEVGLTPAALARHLLNAAAAAAGGGGAPPLPPPPPPVGRAQAFQLAHVTGANRPLQAVQAELDEYNVRGRGGMGGRGGGRGGGGGGAQWEGGGEGVGGRGRRSWTSTAWGRGGGGGVGVGVGDRALGGGSWGLLPRTRRARAKRAAPPHTPQRTGLTPADIKDPTPWSRAPPLLSDGPSPMVRRARGRVLPGAARAAPPAPPVERPIAPPA